MADKYFIDLEKYPLDKYREILKESELLPGRRILHEQLDKRFDRFKMCGITDLQQLVENLKTKSRISHLSADTGVPEEYLVILKRELNRLLPKTVTISEFPGADTVLVSKLNEIGVKNTGHLFKQCDTRKKRNALSNELNTGIDKLEELTKMADLSRIWGVGPVFCRIFYETGVDTVKKVAKAKAEPLYKALMKVNEEKKYTKARFVVKDVALCIDIAEDLPKTIEI